MYNIEDLKNTVHCADCLTFMKGIPDNSVDSVVTDPPYELGFMGKSWDNTGIANNPDMWKECLRVLKPGGHLLAFSGTRTYHRMASAIEDAGFEVRDMIEWVYGSGFPKSLNIGKAVDKLQGNEREIVGQSRNGSNSLMGGLSGTETTTIQDITKGTSEWEGWGTALKPAHEPICLARKPLAEKTVAENCLKYGTGGINIDESRVGTEEITIHGYKGDSYSQSYKENGTKPELNEYKQVSGRFPANLILDNSEEVRECFPDTKSVKSARGGNKTTDDTHAIRFGSSELSNYECGFNDSGNASRFFKSIPTEEQDEIQEECTSMEEKLEKLCFLPEAAKSIIYQAKASKSERQKGCEDLYILKDGISEEIKKEIETLLDIAK